MKTMEIRMKHRLQGALSHHGRRCDDRRRRAIVRRIMAASAVCTCCADTWNHDESIPVILPALITIEYFE